MAHWLGVTSEENWSKCLTHGIWGASENRFRALQQMKIGDDLLVYLKPMRIVGIFQITKEYFHDSTRIWKDGLLPHRVGFQPKPSKVPLKGIDIRSLYNSYFKSNKGSPRGYFGMGIRGLPEEEFSVFEAEIDKNIIGKTGAEVFLTGYPEGNLEISKKQQILGWERNPKDISIGDLVFVYNKNSKKIECGFRIKSKSNRTDPIWESEINANLPQQKYSFRWDAEPICHDLNIDYNTIRGIEPFRPNNRGKKASFYILVTRNSANSLRNPIYRPFRDYLLNECGDGMNKKDEIGWSFDIEKAIDEILLLDTKRELAIDRQLVKRILVHLKAGKHVILVGPPGVGKTDLARRILEIIGKKVIGNDSFLESVASDEWSRYELIGGVNLANEFQEGWVTKAAVDNKWLLIDEFNRANMNKAFGELFLAIEYNKITLRPTESKRYKKNTIEIPQNFRMICTMNDFDKNLLLTELSYGLISRFAFVPITPDIQREPIVVERRVKSSLGNDASYVLCCITESSVSMV